MSWRLAKSLEKLRSQVDHMWPNRSRVSDGSIGDSDHANRSSDHNPWVGPGVVTAIDITHDPKNGADMNVLANRLKRSKDSRIKYIIWNRRIWNPSVASHWRSYSGSNPHDKHLHLSVKAEGYDNTMTWQVNDPPKWRLKAIKRERRKEAVRAKWSVAKRWIRDKAKRGFRVVVRRK